MRRKIYTKKESLKNTWVILGISVVFSLYFLFNSRYWENGMTYLALLIGAGCMIWQTVEALQWRKKHQMCMETQTPRKGWIVDCDCEVIRHRSPRASYTEYRYYLIVEIYPQGLSTPMDIRSDAYTWPVYQALSSPEVDVYYSDTEAGYTLDGFQYKADNSEPDILPESLRKSLPGRGVGTVIFCIVLLVLLLTVRYKYL